MTTIKLQRSFLNLGSICSLLGNTWESTVLEDMTYGT
jgi:hypothetical protein